MVLILVRLFKGWAIMANEIEGSWTKFLRAIITSSLRQAKASPYVLADWDLFLAFHVLNYCMYFEAQKGFDIMEEKGLLRQKAKLCFNKCERMWSAYRHHIKRDLPYETFGLVNDFFVQVHGNIEEELTYLRVAVDNLLLRNNVPNAEACSYMITALRIWDIIDKMWESHRQLFLAVGRGFRRYFSYSDMGLLAGNIEKAYESLIQTRGNFAIKVDDAYSAADNALANKISSHNFFQEAARTAIRFSKTYSEAYDEIIGKKDGEVTKLNE